MKRVREKLKLRKDDLMLLKFLNILFTYSVVDTRATCSNFQTQAKKTKKFP